MICNECIANVIIFIYNSNHSTIYFGMFSTIKYTVNDSFFFRGYRVVSPVLLGVFLRAEIVSVINCAHNQIKDFTVRSRSQVKRREDYHMQTDSLLEAYYLSYTAFKCFSSARTGRFNKQKYN